MDRIQEDMIKHGQLKSPFELNGCSLRSVTCKAYVSDFQFGLFSFYTAEQINGVQMVTFIVVLNIITLLYFCLIDQSVKPDIVL